MKILVSAKYNLVKEVNVYSLSFDPENRQFFMAYQFGSGAGAQINCPVAAVPTELTAIGTQYRVNFSEKQDAEAFCAWLIKSEAIAQEGYQSMTD